MMDELGGEGGRGGEGRGSEMPAVAALYRYSYGGPSLITSSRMILFTKGGFYY